MDIFRVFDSLNSLPNMTVAMEAVRNAGKVCEAAICYTGDILDPKRDKYSLRYYVSMAKELERMGAHVLGIKDMAGLCTPYAAEKLVRALRDEVGLPLHFHTHDTSGINAASILKAAEAGVHAADAAISSMSGTTSQPNLDAIAVALANTPRDTGLPREALQRCADYWEIVRAWYQPFDDAPKTGTAEVYFHEMPGGQYTNLKAQVEAMGLGHRWPEVARRYAEVNLALGDIVKVTPSSKAVGDLALFLVSHDMTIGDFEQLGAAHATAVPNSVIDLVGGSLGEPMGGWPARIQDVVLKGKAPLLGRPGAELPAADLEAEAVALEQKVGHAVPRADLMSYLMYPDVYLKFSRARQAWGDLAVLPTPPFFYGMRTGEEITLDLEPGKTLIVRLLAVGEPQPEGTRTVFFELNGQPREVTVRDRSLEVKTEVRAKADPRVPGEIGAPIPGTVLSMAVAVDERVEQGDTLVVLEAMKMQATVTAPIAGTVVKALVSPGRQVEAKDLLLVIAP